MLQPEKVSVVFPGTCEQGIFREFPKAKKDLLLESPGGKVGYRENLVVAFVRKKKKEEKNTKLKFKFKI